MEFILIAILGIISSWEEGQQLIQRGSWSKADYRFPIWDIDWRSTWKNFDSHHAAFGLFVLIMGLSFYVIRLESIWSVLVVWFVFFYVRNVGLHIIFKKKPEWIRLIKFWR